MQTIIERLNECLAGDWGETLTRFRVVDVPAEPDPARSLLVCESPHIDEVTDEPVECRFPLRGTAGKNVTKALVECREPAALQHGGEARNTVPVGQLVAQGHLDSIRIVNVCELPLQSEAYTQRLTDTILQTIPRELAFKEWCRLLLAFRTVRGLRRNSPETCDPLVAHILDDFRHRLGDLEQVRNLPAVVCGLSAQACWLSLGLPEPNCSNDVRFVAHPSWKQRWFDGSQLRDNVCIGLLTLLGRA